MYYYSIFSTKSKEKLGDFPKYGKLFFMPIYQKTPNFFGVFFVLLFIDYTPVPVAGPFQLVNELSFLSRAKTKSIFQS